jgi:hypothetical protein
MSKLRNPYRWSTPMSHWIRSGLIAGAVLSVLMLAPILILGPRPEWMKWGEILGYTWMVLCLTATYFAMRSERVRRGGVLGFGAALGIGAGVSLVAALLFGLATWVTYALAGDELPQKLYEFYVQGIRDSGLDAAAQAAKLAELEQMKGLFFNQPLQAAVMFATVFLIGIAESIIGALIVRRIAPQQR